MTLLYNIDRSLFSPQRLLAWLSLGGVLLFLTPLYGHAQSTGSVEGRVVDAQDGTPLPGANVIVEGTSIGVSTNQDGRYRLTNVPTGSQTLTVTYVSYREMNKSVDVEAGTPKTLNFEIKSKVLEGGEVVVTGMRGSQFRSVNQKKQAFNIVDALAADRIGNLPEKNVAEAVQRLPGIVLRNDRTEGRFVSIRGGAANLNNVTLNGNTLASTAGSRATALDLLPAEMVSNVEVTKAVTPDMPGNAIGGSININTLSAFDQSGGFAFASVRGLRHDQQVPGLRDFSFPFRANLTAGTQFGARDDFGIVVSASGSRRDFSTSGLKGEGWDDAAERDLPTSIPYAQEQIVETHRRQRFAVNTSLDWQPTSQISVYLRPYFTYTNEESLDNELEYNLLGEPTPMESGAAFQQGFGSLDLSKTSEDESLWGASAGLEHQFGEAITWSASGTYSRGILDETTPDGEFNTAVTEDAGGVADMSEFLFDFYPTNPQYVGEARNYEASNIDVGYTKNTEDTYSAKTDLRIPVQIGEYSGFLQTGGKLLMRDKRVDGAELEFLSTETVRLSQFEAPTVSTVQVGNNLMPFGDTDAFVDWFMNEGCNPPDNRFSGDRTCRTNGPYEMNAEEVAVEDIERDSDNEEDIYAGYLMGSAQFGSVSVLAGARVENTQTLTRRYQAVNSPDSEGPVTSIQEQTNAYTDILPSVHLILDATSALKFRAAWTNTIGRPDYDDLSAFREVEVEPLENSDLYTASVEQGNPNLQPYEAMNFDLSAEYYFQNGGMASVTGFHKTINNPIYTFGRTDRNVSNLFGEGRTFQTVGYSQQRNANTGTVLGLEVICQQPLTFLPAPADGLGITSNLTVTDSEVDIPEREENLRFFEQADLVYNIIPYFQKQGFELRVAWNFRGDYLEGLGDIPAEDLYVSERTTVDVNASYKISGILGEPQLLVQVENLTNAPEVEYANQENHLAYHHLSGRTVTMGVSTSF